MFVAPVGSYRAEWLATLLPAGRETGLTQNGLRQDIAIVRRDLSRVISWKAPLCSDESRFELSKTPAGLPGSNGVGGAVRASF